MACRYLNELDWLLKKSAVFGFVLKLSVLWFELLTILKVDYHHFSIRTSLELRMLVIYWTGCFKVKLVSRFSCFCKIQDKMGADFEVLL